MSAPLPPLIQPEELRRELPDLGGFPGGRQSCNEAEWAEYEWACRIHQAPTAGRPRRSLADRLSLSRRPAPVLPPVRTFRRG